MMKKFTSAVGAIILAGAMVISVPMTAVAEDETTAVVEAVEVTPIVEEVVQVAPVVEPAVVVEAPIEVAEEAPAEVAPVVAKAQSPPEVKVGYDPILNQPSYWKALYPHAVECYKSEGNTAHGSITNGGKKVTLNAFVQSWPGDHWEVLVIKAGTENTVYEHPTAGVAYDSPNNKKVSHWIVCKGETPIVVPEKPEPQVSLGEWGNWSSDCESAISTRTRSVSTNDWELIDNKWVLVEASVVTSETETRAVTEEECPTDILPTCTTVTGAQHFVGEEYVGNALTLVTTEAEQAYWLVPFTGKLKDIGTVLEVQASPSAEVGLWIYVDGQGWIVYEEGQYGGNLWSKSSFAGIPAGSGYAASAPIEDYIAIYGDLDATVYVLYGASKPGTTTVSSVTVGCTTYTFEYKRPDAPVTPEPVYGEWSTPVIDCTNEVGDVVDISRTVTTTKWVWEEDSWVAVETESVEPGAYTVTETDIKDLDCPVTPIVDKPVPTVKTVVPSGSLASTGFDNAWLFGGAGVLSVLGGGLMFLRRRFLQV